MPRPQRVDRVDRRVVGEVERVGDRGGEEPGVGQGPEVGPPDRSPAAAHPVRGVQGEPALADPAHGTAAPFWDNRPALPRRSGQAPGPSARDGRRIRPRER
ncbi:hypothetical protein ACFW5I_14335 [Streptomyces sp. NPDC058818]|uniref:hypothetical protein n=1 Tax=Streptomyces sp. NPDC058818 TaxID=3346640 RepID=UPI0036B6CE0C